MSVWSPPGEGEGVLLGGPFGGLALFLIKDELAGGQVRFHNLRAVPPRHLALNVTRASTEIQLTKR